jgi:hypothetical protein
MTTTVEDRNQPEAGQHDPAQPGADKAVPDQQPVAQESGAILTTPDQAAPALTTPAPSDTDMPGAEPPLQPGGTGPNPSVDNTAQSRGGLRLVAVLALVVVCFGVAYCGYRTIRSLRPLAVAAQGGCDKATTMGQPGAQPGAQGALKLQEGQLTRVDFARSISVKTVRASLDVTGTVAATKTPLFTRVGTFRRTDDGRLNERNIIASAVITGRTALLTVCFGRQDNRLGDPGVYNGTITIDDARLSGAVTIPFTVTMQYPHPGAVLWLIVAVLLPGIWVLWVVHTRRAPDKSAIALREFLRWLGSTEGVVSTVTGGIAAIGVFTATYLRDPTWGSSSLQSITLFGAMFTAFVTTAGITQITHLAAITNPNVDGRRT